MLVKEQELKQQKQATQASKSKGKDKSKGEGKTGIPRKKVVQLNVQWHLNESSK